MSNEKYVPVGNFKPAIGKFENLAGINVPDKMIEHWNKYNLGTIGDVTLYGISATVKQHTNLLIGLTDLRALNNFPSKAIPVANKGDYIYCYDTQSQKVVAYSQSNESVKDVDLTLDTLVTDLTSNKTVSTECAIPENLLHRICSFIKNEFDMKDRSYAISLALAYSLELDAHSDSTIAYYGNYHSDRVNEILSVINERALLDLSVSLKLTRDLYLMRCEFVRNVPSSKVEHLQELDEKQHVKVRELSKFLKDVIR